MKFKAADANADGKLDPSEANTPAVAAVLKLPR